MKRHLLIATAFLGLTCVHAQAATVSSTLGVSLTLAAACVVSTTAVAFGSVGLIPAAVDQTGTVSVTCTKNSTYTVALDAGASAGATTSVRKMKNGAATEFVTYGLYRDAARSQNWGNTVGTDTAAGTGSGSATLFTIYGRIPVQSSPTPGAYADSVNVTVAY
jgi:spore coat protein U-like protein